MARIEYLIEVVGSAKVRGLPCQLRAVSAEHVLDLVARNPSIDWTPLVASEDEDGKAVLDVNNPIELKITEWIPTIDELVPDPGDKIDDTKGNEADDADTL